MVSPIHQVHQLKPAPDQGMTPAQPRLKTPIVEPTRQPTGPVSPRNFRTACSLTSGFGYPPKRRANHAPATACADAPRPRESGGANDFRIATVLVESNEVPTFARNDPSITPGHNWPPRS